MNFFHLKLVHLPSTWICSLWQISPGGATADRPTDRVIYQTVADTSKANGNGYMQNAAYVKSMTSTQVKDHLPRILGADMITIAQDAVESSYTGPNVFNRADAKTIQGVYGSEIVAKSGQLSFPKDGVPSDWNAQMSVTVSYQ
ncbi:hypothetical protein ACXPSQ_000940 [Salmonella enterica subsp. enterica serovar Newport]